jgi:tetratricopeptide (TPR) repeat protein
LSVAHPDVVEYRRDLSGSHIDLANLYDDTGRMAEAEASYGRALTIKETLAKEHPELTDDRNKLAIALHNFGNLYSDTRRTAQAEASFRRAVGIWQELAAAHPDVTEYRRNLATGHYSLGRLRYQEAGRTAEAEASFRGALRIREELAAAHPEEVGYRLDLAASHNALGWLYKATGRTVEAEAEFRRALRIREGLAAAHPDTLANRDTVAAIHNALGLLYEDTGRVTEAEASLERARAIWQELAAAHPEQANFALSLGGFCCNLGNLRCDRNQPQAALAWYDRAAAALEAVRRRIPTHPTARQYLRNTYMGRADALSRLGRGAEALADCDRATAMDDERTHELPRLRRAIVLARAGDHRRAAAEAAALAELAPGPTPRGAREYDLACVLALVAAAARGDATLAPADRASAGERYAARAIALLGQARDAGFFLDPAKVTLMDRDSDLIPLRPRADFQALRAALMDQGFPTDPFAHEAPAQGPAGSHADRAAAAGRIGACQGAK